MQASQDDSLTNKENLYLISAFVSFIEATCPLIDFVLLLMKTFLVSICVSVDNITAASRYNASSSSSLFLVRIKTNPAFTRYTYLFVVYNIEKSIT